MYVMYVPRNEKMMYVRQARAQPAPYIRMLRRELTKGGGFPIPVVPARKNGLLNSRDSSRLVYCYPPRVHIGDHSPHSPILGADTVEACIYTYVRPVVLFSMRYISLVVAVRGSGSYYGSPRPTCLCQGWPFGCATRYRRSLESFA